MTDKINEQVQIYAGGTWLGDNLQAMKHHERILEGLDTQRDAVPRGFQPRAFLQFIRGAVNEIKRLTAENHAFREALKMQNRQGGSKD
jgi:hypothetical protein